jgi:sugar phosphate isomerase/epimerase
MEVMTDNIGAIAEIGKRHGIHYQIELIAYTPFNTLEQGLKIIKDVGTGNLGMVVDFWHLHAAGINTPADVAAMDPNLIYDIHFCDGRQPRLGEGWKEDILRNYLPGEGDIDVQAWTNAVLSTGYDGWWAPELASPLHWEDDLLDISRVCLNNMSSYIEKGKEMLA